MPVWEYGRRKLYEIFLIVRMDSLLTKAGRVRILLCGWLSHISREDAETIRAHRIHSNNPLW